MRRISLSGEWAGVFLALCFLSAGCALQDDVAFARAAMTQLIEGRYFCIQKFDWPVLVIGDMDVGSEYSKFKTESEQLGYARGFVKNFSRGYQASGAKASALFGWKKYEGPLDVGAGVTAVGAYVYDKRQLFLFLVSHHPQGVRKIRQIVFLIPQEEVRKGLSQVAEGEPDQVSEEGGGESYGQDQGS